MPQSYLKRFCAIPKSKQEPFLWVIDKNKKDQFRRSPKKVAVKSYYYSFTDENGTQNVDVENYLSSVESNASLIIEKLCDGAVPSDLSLEERAHLSIFIAFLGHRVPHFRTHWEKQMGDLMKHLGIIIASNSAYFNSLMKELIGREEVSPDIDIEETRQLLLSGDYNVFAKPIISLQIMSEMTELVSKEIYQFNWRILRGDKHNSFITSDDPLTLVTTMKLPPLYGGSVGWYLPYMEATLPLSPRTTLLISQHHPEGEELIGAPRVHEVNLRTLAYCNEQIYSKKKISSSDLMPAAGWKWWQPLSEDVIDEFRE